MSIFGNPVVIGGGGSSPVIQALSATANGTYTAPSGVDGYSPVTVNVEGGSTLVTKTITENGTYDATDDNADGYSEVTVNVSGVDLLTQAQWDALTTAQKQSYGLVAIQRAVSGYLRGVLVNGADYFGLMLLQQGTAATSAAFLVDFDGAAANYLMVLALNSEASTYDLNISASRNGTALSGETLAYNAYYSSDTNRRNYRMMLFPISPVVGDEISIALSNYSGYTSFVYALVNTQFAVMYALSTADSICSGSYALPGFVLYGTFNSSVGGTLNSASYTEGDTVTTAYPGSGYRSAYIFFVNI